MKKLMLAVAVISAAVMAEAATIKWSASGLVDSKGTALVDSTLGDFTVAWSLWDSDGTTLLVDNAKGTFTALNGSISGQYDNSLTGHNYWIQAIVTDKSGATLESDKAMFTTSSSSTFKPNLATGGNMPEGKGIFHNTGTNYGWQTVPEPTSGLLLLLGVAGLALRRRRA